MVICEKHRFETRFRLLSRCEQRDKNGIIATQAPLGIISEQKCNESDHAWITN